MPAIQLANGIFAAGSDETTADGFRVGPGALVGSVSTGPSLRNVPASQLNPTICPDRSVPTTGFSSASSASISHIVSGVQKINTTATGTAYPLPSTTTLGVAATTFAVVNNVMVVTGDSGGNTVATISAGVDGQRLTLVFTNDKVTLTDTAVAAATSNKICLTGAYTSAAGDTMSLVLAPVGASGASVWLEVSRSVNG